MATNWIAQHILVELTRHSTRRYSELRPDGVEGNLFSYHLDGLVKDGLVEKGDQAYRLTVKGKQLVGTLSLETGRTRRQPKILTAVVARNEAGEWLLVRWRREPNTGLVSLPHGMMHYGRTAAEMAAVELAEKAGLVANELKHVGEVYVRGMRGEEVDRHMLVVVFEAAAVQPGRQDEVRPEVAEALWARPESVARQDWVPGFWEIMELVRDRAEGPVFAELTIEVEDKA